MFNLYFLDVNECFPDHISKDYFHLHHNCHEDANCTNIKGSFYCTCHTGYSGDGVTCEGKMPEFTSYPKRLVSPIQGVDVFHSVSAFSLF